MPSSGTEVLSAGTTLGLGTEILSASFGPKDVFGGFAFLCGGQAMTKRTRLKALEPLTWTGAGTSDLGRIGATVLEMCWSVRPGKGLEPPTWTGTGATDLEMRWSLRLGQALEPLTWRCAGASDLGSGWSHCLGDALEPPTWEGVGLGGVLEFRLGKGRSRQGGQNN